MRGSTSDAKQRPKAVRGTIALAAVTALGLSATASYTVASGDTLAAIGAAHGVSAQEIAAHNGIANPDHIVEGTTIELPGSGGGEPQPEEPQPEEPAPEQPAPAPGSQAEVGALIEQVSLEHGWSPGFVKAIAWQESGWNQNAVSPKGARGIMQIMPATGEWVGSALAGRHLNIDDPHDNVLAGVLYLDYLHQVSGGDIETILAGYYQGLGSLQEIGMYDDTRAYIDSVQHLRNRF